LYAVPIFKHCVELAASALPLHSVIAAGAAKDPLSNLRRADPCVCGSAAGAAWGLEFSLVMFLASCTVTDGMVIRHAEPAGDLWTSKLSTFHAEKK
jgi:hypothetical protein